jgi:transposase
MEEKLPPDKQVYKVIKTSLKSVVKHQDTLNKLNQICITANHIMIHSLQFLKLYLLHLFQSNKPFPTLNKLFMVNLIKTVCEKPKKGRPPGQKAMDVKSQLSDLFRMHYQPLMKNTKTLSYTYLNTVIDYMAIEIVTNIENNIKQHFIEYVERYVNVILDKKVKIKQLETKEEINHLCNQLRKIKSDLLEVTTQPLKCDVQYHDWVQLYKCKVKPSKKSFDKNNLYYDLQCNPQDYLPCMFVMMQEIEKSDPELFIYQTCPLRSNVIPKHLKFDTTTLLHVLRTEKYGSQKMYNDNLTKYQDQLWKFFFRTDKKCFAHHSDELNGDHYVFNHMISTDGVSCSILLIKQKHLGTYKPRQKKSDKTTDELYIDEITDPEHLADLRHKNCVGIDPNKSDLIYCTNGKLEFRYTQNQRRKETKMKKYKKIRESNKKSTIIKGKTIEEWESTLSQYNKKTLDFAKFKEYVDQKNTVNEIIGSFYEEQIYRKLNLNGYMNRQRSEQRMINRFEKMFGRPGETCVMFGDYEQRKQMKYKEPTKGKGMRKMFRKAGHETYLIDEYKTSCSCYKCHGRTETFKKCENPRPWKKGEQITCHGLVMCKTCNSLWNRDVNASLNIRCVGLYHLDGKERPGYLRRGKTNQ